MGRGQHSKDKTYITATEWGTMGGHKGPSRTQGVKKLPLQCCSLSLSPWSTPVMTPNGVVFDFVNVVPFIRKFKRNPSTGEEMQGKDLVKLHFAKNAEGALIDPVTFEPLTEHTKVAAIKTTGNVYAYTTLQELCIGPKSWRDLIDSSPFTRADIVVLQDPSDPSWLAAHDINNFAYVKEGWASATDFKPGAASAVSTAGDTAAAVASGAAEVSFSGTGTVRLNDSTRRILAEVEAKHGPTATATAGVKRSRAELEEGEAASGSSAPSNADASHGGHVTGWNVKTSGKLAASFTSSAVSLVTRNEAAKETDADRDERRWEWVRSKGQKALLRITTNKGPLNVELHCDLVPRICENFLLLASRNYYTGTTFHRSIKNFMIQGGDPTGTGRGGNCAWAPLVGTEAEKAAKTVKDEFHQKLSHSDRGVLSMANSGPDTNRSQFFITFRACTHLDRKHSVFGRLVGGQDTLRLLEQVATDKTDKPVETLKIDKIEVFQNPFDEYYARRDEIEKERRAAVAAAVRGGSGSSVLGVGSSVSHVGHAGNASAAASKATKPGDEDGERPWLAAPAPAEAGSRAPSASGPSLTQMLASIGPGGSSGSGSSASASAAAPVGARLAAALAATTATATSKSAGPASIPTISAIQQPKTGGFGSFTGW
jgi:peptidyl-prolyl cis-trans isomerase-like protein 2